jgi:hypothetical protein
VTYIFTHIRKTGGTTFHTSYLPNAFAPGECVVVSGGIERHQIELDSLKALPAGEKARLRAIAGHSTSQLRPYFPDARFISLVREPHKRVISMYRHALYHMDGEHPVGKYIRAHGLSFLDFLEGDVFDRVLGELLPDRSTEGFSRCTSVRNAQAQQLTGLPECEIDVTDRDRLWGLVQRRFHLVGTTEDYWRFVFHLHVEDEFPLLLFNDRLVRSQAQAFHPSESELARVKELTRLDTALYELVKEKFDERVTATWSEEAVNEYHQYRAALAEFKTDTDGNENAVAAYAPRAEQSAADVVAVKP